MVEMPTESEPVRVVQGDCLDVLRTLPDGCVDAVITDPPYGIGLMIHRNRTGERLQERYQTILGDESTDIGIAALFWASERGLPTVAFANPMTPWPGKWRQHLVWDKGAGVGGLGDYRRCWKQTWELIQVARNGDLRAGRDSAILRFPVKPGTKRHHAEKPVELMRYLVRQLTAPGELILDPFAGSGTTGVAAISEGRRCLLIEKEPAYAEICRRRVREAMGTGLLAGIDG